ncbi:MAG: FGGY family carbohydrate kinase [Promethearchaeota archaeon]
MYVASLDLGTTGCRTFIFNLAGEIIASDYQEWQSYYPTPTCVEQNADNWWDSIKKTSSLAIKKSGIDPSEIVSISITNQISG